MPKLPAIQIYPGDWKKDPAVRSCSIAARGLWWEILLSMFDCPERGILKSGDVPWGIPEIAAASGIPTSSAATLLEELEKKGVFSRRESDGAIFNRRMVRDEEARVMSRERVKRFRNGGVTHYETPMKRSSSSSVSFSNQNHSPSPPSGGQIHHFEVYGQIIEIQMGRHRRLPSTKHLVGAMPSQYVDFFCRQGFPAEIIKAS